MLLTSVYNRTLYVSHERTTCTKANLFLPFRAKQVVYEETSDKASTGGKVEDNREDVLEAQSTSAGQGM